MNLNPKATLVAASVLCSFLGACSSGSSGGGISSTAITESEPNDMTTQAKSLRVGEFGLGTVTDDTDTDFWKVNLSANQLITVEVFGNRLDQAGWSGNFNAARVTLFDTDGTTMLIDQSDENFQWTDDQDTDIFTFRAPASGSYFLALNVATAGSGGDYLVTVQPTTVQTPIQMETEGEGMTGVNDTDATAQAITPGTVVGFHVDDESDFYSFTVTNPSLVTFETHGHRNGDWKSDTYYDPFIVLYDSALNTLDSDDDSYYLDSSVHYLVTTPGTYFIEVTECCAAGDSGYFLEFTLDEFATLNPVAEVEPNDAMGTAQMLQFGDFVQGDVAPGTDDYFAIACNAGDRIYVQVFDSNNFQDALSSVNVTIEDGLAMIVPAEGSGGGLQFERTILTATGTYFVHVTAGTATDYALRIMQEPADFETEPNDTVANAGTFDADGLAAGVMDQLADNDIFAFQGRTNVPVIFSVLADNVGPNGYFEVDDFGSSLAPVINVLDAASNILATSDSTFANAVGIRDGIASVSLAFLPPSNGTFFVEVVDEAGSFGADFTYVLQMR